MPLTEQEYKDADAVYWSRKAEARYAADRECLMQYGCKLSELRNFISDLELGMEQRLEEDNLYQIALKRIQEHNNAC